MNIIDLRSDTVTKPTPAMLDAMLSAEVGDDVFESDPSVNQLQELAADMFGKEAGLFCPSGTMTNQIAIALQSGPLTEVIADDSCHVYNYEVGGISFNARASVKLLPGDRGRLTVEQIANAVNPDDVHKAKTRLVCLENTSNRGGGACYQLREIEKISEFCRRQNLALHLDGARLCNAAVKQDIALPVFGQLFDTVSICLSKGLGAPVGSLLLGDKGFVREARRMRKVMGGGMRQAGFLAGAGIYALKNNIDRLVEDHQLAYSIAEVLNALPYVESIMEPETNIVIFNLDASVRPEKFLAHLDRQGMKAINFGGQSIRFVTHLDVAPNDLNRISDALKGFC